MRCCWQHLCGPLAAASRSRAAHSGPQAEGAQTTVGGRRRGRSREPRRQWRSMKPPPRLADHLSASSRLPAKDVAQRPPHIWPRSYGDGGSFQPHHPCIHGPTHRLTSQPAPGSQAAYYGLPRGGFERLQTTPSDYQTIRGRPAKAGVGGCPARGSDALQAWCKELKDNTTFSLPSPYFGYFHTFP